MSNLVAKLNKSVIEVSGQLELRNNAWQNVRARGARLSGLLTHRNPDLYILEYIMPGREKSIRVEWEHLEPAIQSLDTIIRAGASYALLQALWMAPDGTGEAFVNIALHDLGG